MKTQNMTKFLRMISPPKSLLHQSILSPDQPAIKV